MDANDLQLVVCIEESVQDGDSEKGYIRLEMTLDCGV